MGGNNAILTPLHNQFTAYSGWPDELRSLYHCPMSEIIDLVIDNLGREGAIMIIRFGMLFSANLTCGEILMKNLYGNENPRPDWGKMDA